MSYVDYLKNCSLHQLFKEIDEENFKSSLAIKFLINRFHPSTFYVCSYFLRRGRVPDQIIEDVALELSSDVMYAVLEKFPRNREAEIGFTDLSNWIFKVSRNKSLNYVRDNQSKIIEDSSAIIDEIFGNDQVHEMEQKELRAEEEEKYRIIVKLVEDLTEVEKIILLKEFGGEDLNDKKISGLIGVSYDYVRKKRKQVRDSLIKKYKRIMESLRTES
ncbi:MAG: sigma-70 family RNA polymerase sigma factor [Bacteroidia bacterium]|nr:sigma-70 family RNA polymerase sigma factor [Bacteroidia bacterium]